MPNHIVNILKASSHVLDALKGDEHLVDFNSIIPMPESIRGIKVNGDERLVEFLNGKLSLNPSSDDFLSSLQLSNVLRNIESGGMTKWNDCQFENFVTMLRNYREYGITSWYDFSIKHWGTKWNAYDIVESDGGIEFQTAWNAPHPIIAKLAEKFPDEKITHLWSDEDIGSNLGHHIYHFGSLTEVVVEDPMEFALSLHPRSREYYVKNPDTGVWEDVDS